MSRIGTQPISLPSGVTLTQGETHFEVVGSKGTLTVPLFENIIVKTEENNLIVELQNPEAKNFFGLLRSLLANAVQGVSTGWTRELELQGVGMRANLTGTTLNLSLGFSHPVTVTPPTGISFTVQKNIVTVSGIDKQLVGETAAKIRSLRPPEPYKGKGIRYVNEFVRRKAGKTGKAAK